jgi:CheY-like chemotaxis protein
MSDDLVSFKMLVVSEAASERQVLRRAAAEAAFPVDYREIEQVTDPAPTCAVVEKDALDFIFVDSRMPKPARQAVFDAAQAVKGRPLVIFVGPADHRTREVWSDGAAADGVLAKPIDPGEASAIIGVCARARLSKRVLVVDDSSTVRSVVRKVLQASRFRLETVEAADGKAALEQVRKQHVEVVFLDCNMPGLDGFAVLDTLTRDHPDVQVVMITGARDIRIEDRARAAGAKEFLYKPFYANDIDAVLHRLFGFVAPKAH